MGSGTLEIAQTFPALMDHLSLIVKKVGDMKLASAQIDRQQEEAIQGTPVIIGAGSNLPAGHPITISLSGLAHHSNTPRRVTLAIAMIIILAGVWGFTRTSDSPTVASEHKRLIGRREKLLQELVRLEQDRRKGKVEPQRADSRRRELFAALEPIYAALDDETGGLSGAARPPTRGAALDTVRAS